MRRGATEIIFTHYMLRLMFSILKSNAVKPSCNLRNLCNLRQILRFNLNTEAHEARSY